MSTGQSRGKPPCSVDWCERQAHSRGFCSAHYYRWKTYGDPLLGGEMQARLCGTPKERFWPKVNKHGPIPDYRPELGPCWVWTAAMATGGYGAFGVGRRKVYAHRFAYELLVGPIPEGLEIDHLCRVRACVNPTHLEAVTHRENDIRGFGASGIHARKTHCFRGHPFDENNTYKRANGKRVCRTCTLERQNKRRKAKST